MAPELTALLSTLVRSVQWFFTLSQRLGLHPLHLVGLIFVIYRAGEWAGHVGGLFYWAAQRRQEYRHLDAQVSKLSSEVGEIRLRQSLAEDWRSPYRQAPIVDAEVVEIKAAEPRHRSH